MSGTHWLGRYRFRLPLIASILYLLIVGLAHGTMYLVESSDDGFVMGIQNLIIATYALTTLPWMWALESLGLLHGNWYRFPTTLGFVLVHTLNVILIFATGFLIVKFRKRN
jgi:hypothetical protein